MALHLEALLHKREQLEEDLCGEAFLAREWAMIFIILGMCFILQEVRSEVELRNSARTGLILQCSGRSMRFLASAASTSVLQSEKKTMDLQFNAFTAGAATTNPNASACKLE